MATAPKNISRIGDSDFQYISKEKLWKIRIGGGRGTGRARTVRFMSPKSGVKPLHIMNLSENAAVWVNLS